MSPYIIHVVFNDSSYNDLAITPWDRNIYGRVISILEKTNVNLIAYDIFFRDESSPENDTLLIDATKSGDMVYYPIILYEQDITGNQIETEELDIIAQNIWQPVILKEGSPHTAELGLIPFYELSSNARGLGHVNIDPDSDGVNRRFPLLYKYKEGYIPSLILRVICDFLKVNHNNVEISFGNYINLKNAVLPGNIIKDIKIPIDDAGRVFINYVAPWKDSFFEFSVKDILDTWI